jgi:hypothetical protein
MSSSPLSPSLFSNLIDTTAAGISAPCSFLLFVEFAKIINQNILKIVWCVSPKWGARGVHPFFVQQYDFLRTVADIFNCVFLPLPKIFMARHRKWNLFAPLQSEYLLAGQGPAPTGTPRGGAPAPSGRGSRFDCLNLGARTKNPRPLYSWMQKFNQSGKEPITLTPPKDDQGNDLCMSWHLRGYCYGNCTRKASQCLLVGSTRTRMQSIAQRFQFPEYQAGHPEWVPEQLGWEWVPRGIRLRIQCFILSRDSL